MNPWAVKSWKLQTGWRPKRFFQFQVLVYGTDTDSQGDEDVDTVALGALIDSVLPAPFDGQELVRVIQSLSGT